LPSLGDHELREITPCAPLRCSSIQRSSDIDAEANRLRRRRDSVKERLHDQQHTPGHENGSKDELARDHGSDSE
jgi:hypothetical protein